MNNSEGAIPFIIFESGKFAITQEAITFLSAIDKPLGVVSIVGKYRTGKSLFLNKVLLNNSESFKVCPTINSCTKGLWISRQIIQSQNPEFMNMDVIVIDSEGFGAMEQSDNYNNKILLLALLLSSYFIYNSVGSIDEKSLNNLNVITNIAKELQSKNMQNDCLESQFPSFMWIVRDFTLRLLDDGGFPIQSKDYLEKALEIQKGVSDATEGKNKIRRVLKHFFRERDCCTLVTPVSNQQKLQKLNELPNEQLRPEFLEQAASVRTRILKKLKCKKIKNRQLNGATFIELAQSFISQVNGGSLVSLDAAWKSILNYQSHAAFNKLKQQLAQKVQRLKDQRHMPTEINERERQIIIEAGEKLKKSTSDHTQFENYFKQLQEYLKAIFISVRQQNSRRFYHDMQRQFEANQLIIQPSTNLTTIAAKLQAQQKHFKEKFSTSPCFNDFMAKQFYPHQMTTFTDFVMQLIQKKDNEQAACAAVRSSTEERLQRSEQNNRKLNTQNSELRKQLYILQAKLEEESKIKQLEVTYLQKQVSELKSELIQMEDKNIHLQHLLENESSEAKNIQIRNTQISTFNRQIEHQRNTLKNQVQILQTALTHKSNQIAELNKLISELASNSSASKHSEQVLSSKLSSLEKNSQILASKLQEKDIELSQMHEKISNGESLLAAQSQSFENEKKLYERLLDSLKNTLEQELVHRDKLVESNQRMSLVMAKLQSKLQKSHEKLESYGNFKKCFKNSSCMQCSFCSKFFVPGIFSEHLSVCVPNPGLSSLSSPQQESKIQITVKHTLLKDSNSRPFTEYVLDLKEGSKCWTLSRRYKQFCDLHSSLKTAFPGISLSQYSYIVNPQQGSRKSLLVQERKQILQKYLTDLCNNPCVNKSQLWNDFIKRSQKETTPSKRMTSFLGIEDSRQSDEKQNQQQSAGFHSKTPEQFLKIWNERNCRYREVSGLRDR